MVVIPLVKRALPEAQAAVPGREDPRRDARRRADRAAPCAAGCAPASAPRPPSRAISLVPSLVALRGGDLAAYHGVEHKAIARLRERHDGRRRRRQGARPLRVAPHGAAAGHRTSPGAALLRRALERPGADRAGRGRDRLARHRGRGLRLDRAARRHARPRARCASRATSCSACSARASRPSEQLEVGRAALAEILRVEAPPVSLSHGSVPRVTSALACRRRRSGCRSSACARATTPTRTSSSPRQLLEARRPPPARPHAGLPARGVACSAASTRRSRCCARAPVVARPTATGSRAGTSSRCARCTRATASRRTRPS